jgi:hypothetical protein
MSDVSHFESVFLPRHFFDYKFRLVILTLRVLLASTHERTQGSIDVSCC